MLGAVQVFLRSMEPLGLRCDRDFTLLLANVFPPLVVTATPFKQHVSCHGLPKWAHAVAKRATRLQSPNPVARHQSTDPSPEHSKIACARGGFGYCVPSAREDVEGARTSIILESATLTDQSSVYSP